MVVETDDALDGAGEHFVRRLDACRLAEQIDIESFVPEIAEPLGQDERQVDLLLYSTDHQRNVLGSRRDSGCGQDSGEP